MLLIYWVILFRSLLHWETFSQFPASLHLKINELLSSQLNAKNTLINVEGKSHEEVRELSKEYTDLAKQAEAIEPGIYKATSASIK